MQDGVVLNARWVAALVVHHGSAIQRDGDFGALVVLAPLKLSNAASRPEFVGASAATLNHEIQCHALALKFAQTVTDLLGNHFGKRIGGVGNSPVRSLDHGLASKLFLNALVFCADVVTRAGLG